MALREEQVELTRRRILESFIEMSSDRSRKSVTVADLARFSGISPATIYRHFENRDALVYAAATVNVNHVASAGQPVWQLGELSAHLRRIWSDMAANIAVAREATATETGRELREARFRPFRAMFVQAIERRGVSGDVDELIACLSVLTSAHAFLDMYERQRLSVDDAVAATEWGFATLLRAVGIDPDEFSITEPETTVVDER